MAQYNKTNLIDINLLGIYDEEIKSHINAVSAITMEEAAIPTEGYLKTYVVKQNETEIGKIDLPKELVTTGGEVVVVDDENPVEGVANGTYLKLTIANQEAPVYINVADLVDVYTAQKDATQIQLAISDTNEISATVVANSITKTELAEEVVDEIEDATTAIGKDEDGNLVSVTDRIKAEAKDGIYKEATETEAEITIAEAIEALESASSDTNGALVFKGEVLGLPTNAKIGDTYLMDNALYVCDSQSVDAETQVATAQFAKLAVNGDFKIGDRDVDIKAYIDSRIFVGTTEQRDAALEAGTIDDSTFCVITDEEADELVPVTQTEINALFGITE